MRAAAARDEEAKDRRVNTARRHVARQLLIGRISDDSDLSSQVHS